MCFGLLRTRSASSYISAPSLRIPAPTVRSQRVLCAQRRKKGSTMCCWSSYTWPAYIWSILSILSAITVGVSVYFSNWIQLQEADGRWSSMSPYRICANFSSQITIQCEDYLSFEEMFSDWWRACTILVGAGACFLILVAITSVFGMVVPRLFSKVVTVLIAGVQFIGGESLAV